VLRKLEHQFQSVTEYASVRKSLPQAIDALANQFFTVILLTLLVEPSNILHASKLEKQKPNREHIALVNVVLGEPRVAVDNVRLPQDRRQVLRCTSDRGSCCRAPVVPLTLKHVF
jgi:hypothetical protein